MPIADFLSPADVAIDMRATDKSDLLRDLCERAAASLALNGGAVADAVLKREAIGSTGVGGGVAIPHARIPGLTRPFGILARLKKALDFEAIDGRPVDVVFLLLLPGSAAGEQLNALAAVARRLRDPAALADIRRARDTAQVFRILVS